MAVATDAGQWGDTNHGNVGRTDGAASGRGWSSDGWSNVRPLDRGAAGAVGQWIELLASISHELRTPLNAVIGFSDAMQQEVFGPIGNARYREYVGHIRSSGVELLKAAEDALTMTAVLAQPKASALEDLALAPMLDGALEEIGWRDLGRGVVVEAQIGEGLDVRGDRRILPRAIRQMIAIAHSRAAAGSSIRISAASVHGQVELVVQVTDVVDGAAPLIQPGTELSGFEVGLGRRELALWLASGLLDLMDCRLEVETDAGGLRLRTTLEQSMQGLFFGDDQVCSA